jgi:formylmethanofuran dehydrogenase subunit E
MMIVKCYINNMKNKTIKDTEEKTEATPIAKSPHNICDGCGETIRPDQWSENNFILCIDCG